MKMACVLRAIKEDGKLIVVGFRLSNKMCSTWDVQIRCQHHGWSHHQGENNFTSSNAGNIQRIHLTTDVTQFSHQAAATRAAAPLKALCSAPTTRKPAAAQAAATRTAAPAEVSMKRACHSHARPSSFTTLSIARLPQKSLPWPRVIVGAPKRCNIVSGFSFNQAVKNKMNKKPNQSTTRRNRTTKTNRPRSHWDVLSWWCIVTLQTDLVQSCTTECGHRCSYVSCRYFTAKSLMGADYCSFLWNLRPCGSTFG